MESQPRGSRAIKIKRSNGLANITPELIPGIALGDNAFAERLSHKTTVFFLSDFKNEFGHGVTIEYQPPTRKSSNKNFAENPDLHRRPQMAQRAALFLSCGWIELQGGDDGFAGYSPGCGDGGPCHGWIRGAAGCDPGLESASHSGRQKHFLTWLCQSPQARGSMPRRTFVSGPA